MSNDTELKLVLPNMSSEKTLALAQFIKRLTWDGARQCAVDDDEAYRIMDAVVELQKALDEAGYSPR